MTVSLPLHHSVADTLQMIPFAGYSSLSVLRLAFNQLMAPLAFLGLVS